METSQPERGGHLITGGGAPLAGGRINLFPDRLENGSAEKIQRCVAFMEQNVNRPLQVATLAAQASLSPSHFFALFKQRMGCPPMDYFTQLRMRRACELFDSTTASVKEVAAMMGYDDPFYFSRVFKSIQNVPPSRYREAQFNDPQTSGRPVLTVASIDKSSECISRPPPPKTCSRIDTKNKTINGQCNNHENNNQTHDKNQRPGSGGGN